MFEFLLNLLSPSWMVVIDWWPAKNGYVTPAFVPSLLEKLLDLEG